MPGVSCQLSPVVIFVIYHFSGFVRRLSVDQETKDVGKMVKFVKKKLLRLFGIALNSVKSLYRK